LCSICGRILFEPLDSELVDYQLLYLGKAHFHQVPFKEQNVQSEDNNAWEENERNKSLKAWENLPLAIREATVGTIKPEYESPPM
jgi:hypothetical protein